MKATIRVSRAAKSLAAAGLVLGTAAAQAHTGPAGHWHPENSAALIALGAVAMVAGAVALLRSNKQNANKKESGDA